MGRPPSPPEVHERETLVAVLLGVTTLKGRSGNCAGIKRISAPVETSRGLNTLVAEVSPTLLVEFSPQQ